jgi:ElaB/YqjD/DUF883 family membrane-anchored ribosome-binding protein
VDGHGIENYQDFSRPKLIEPKISGSNGKLKTSPIAINRQQIKTSTNNIMNKQATTTESEHLAEGAQALLAATANVTEAKVVEARKRLSAAIEKGKETWDAVQEKAVAGAKATDQAIREHPYHAIGVAFGVGALIVFLLRSRRD